MQREHEYSPNPNQVDKTTFGTRVSTDDLALCMLAVTAFNTLGVDEIQFRQTGDAQIERVGQQELSYTPVEITCRRDPYYFWAVVERGKGRRDQSPEILEEEIQQTIEQAVLEIREGTFNIIQ